MIARYGNLLAGVVVAAVFLAAGIPKILHPEGFALAIFRYQLVPHGAINLMAVYLPWLEVIAALALLLVPRLRAAAGVVILALLLVFTAAMGINIYRGIDISCGCFSVNPDVSRLSWLNLARNGVLMVLTVFAMMAGGKGEPRMAFTARVLPKGLKARPSTARGNAPGNKHNNLPKP
jgi:hypothetical protein